MTFTEISYPVACGVVSELEKRGIPCVLSADHRADRIYYQELTLLNVVWNHRWSLTVTFSRPRMKKIWAQIEAEFTTEEERCRAPEIIVEQLLRERPELLVENL